MSYPVPAGIADVTVITSYDGHEVMELAFREDEARDRRGRWTATLQYTRMVSTGGYEDVTKEIKGPFYHGGRSRIRPGGQVTAGRRTNSWGDEGTNAKYAHLTTNMETAAAYAREHGARGRLYVVQPTGPVRPGYGSDEYKSEHPLEVVEEIPRREWA